MLRRYLLILILTLLSLLSPIVVHADSRLAILTDIEATMKDFASSLNNLYEDDIIVSEELDRIANVFGSDEYFIFNGRTMDSFWGWLDLYYGQVMQGGYTEHTLHIKERTLEKVDPAEDDDKRYRVKCILERMTDNNQYIPQEVTFIVMWKGEDKYVSILEADGNWGLDIVGISKPGEKFWWFNFPVWGQWTVLITCFLVFMFIVSYAIVKIDNLFHLNRKLIKASRVFGAVLIIVAVYFFVQNFNDYLSNYHLKELENFEVHATFSKYNISWVKKNGKIGMIDYTGELILDYQFDKVGSFSDGLAWVHLRNRAGFVNTNGEVVIPPIYSYVHTFYNEKTLVGNENGYYIINTKGEIVKDMDIDKFFSFKEGMARFERNGLWGYLKEWTYNEIISPIYTSAQDFEDNRAIVQKDNYEGVIDAKNNIIIPFEYRFIIEKDKHFRVKKNNKYGLLDRDGNTVIPVKYDFMHFHIEGKATVYLNGKTSSIEYGNAKQ